MNGTNVNTKSKHFIRKNYNFISRYTYCWAIPTIYRGIRNRLNDTDKNGLLADLESVKLSDALEESWNYEISNYNKPSLWRAILRIYGLHIGLVGIFYFLLVFCHMSVPVIIVKIIEYYNPYKFEYTAKETLKIYVLLIIVLALARAYIYQKVMFKMGVLGMKIRLAVSSLIYRKSLTLSKANLEQFSTGNIVNLFTTNANQFELVLKFVHFIWITPLQIILVIYIIDVNLGHTALTGVFFYIIITIAQTYTLHILKCYCSNKCKQSDVRVKLVSEIIAGIQVIKMYTWEKPFEKLFNIARNIELKQLNKVHSIRTPIVSVKVFSTRVAIFLTIIVDYFAGYDNLNTHFVWQAYNWLDITRVYSVIFMSRGVINLAEAKIAVRRIESFLLTDTTNKVSRAIEQEKSKIFQGCILRVIDVKKRQEYNGVIAKNLSAHWQINLESVLSNVSFTLEPNTLTALIGKTGSGKTTLIQTILKEVPFVNGHMEVNGLISYASQNPWIFSASVKQNILFGQDWNPDKYQKVLEVCCLLTDLDILPFGDETVIGERGVMLSGGQKSRLSLARAVYKTADIYLFDDPLSAVDIKVGQNIFNNCIKTYLKNKCRLLVTHQTQYINEVDVVYSLENGKLSTCTSEAIDQFCELLKNKSINHVDEQQLNKKYKSKLIANNFEEVETNSQKSVFKKYFLLINWWYFPCVVLMLFLLTEIMVLLTDRYLLFLVNLQQAREECKLSHRKCEQDKPFYTKENMLYIYLALISGLIGALIVRNFGFNQFCYKTAKKLQKQMFTNILHSNIRFFHTNPSGRILNRFSIDTNCIDEQIPLLLLDTLQVGANTITATTLISLTNYWFFIPTFILYFLIYCQQRAFVKSGYKLKQIESIRRSFIYSHLTASLQGLVTIRAAEVQHVLKNEFDNHQNFHTATFHSYLGCSSMFGFWNDVLCVIYVSVIAFWLTFYEDNISGSVGLVLSQCLEMCGRSSYFMNCWNDLDSSSTAIERVLEYTHLSQEPETKTITPKDNWPTDGTINFRHVSLAYSDENSPSLNEIDLAIGSGEKIGVVGRTGAGKSSIISALFRLYPYKGAIFIDSIDISQISLETLRSKITLIPQTPFIFSGTIRKNVDPFDEFADEVIWNALEQVDLKQLVYKLPENLSYELSEDGSNLSVGQRQLICLARAVLQKNKIVVLDEATANLDLQTDSLIQKIIRERFQMCTIVTIAHRLETIMDSDRILVMDGGRVVEFDTPQKLLSNKNSVFCKLVETNLNKTEL